MNSYRQIRANYDRESIVVYQAYRKAIAEPALAEGKFVAPFSWSRMTWIKPSYLWMMARSNWGSKTGQEYVLGIRIKRTGWELALEQGVLTCYEKGIHQHEGQWRSQFENASVHIQWDPERTIHGKKLEYRAIQVGISRFLIQQYTDQWIMEIEDMTPVTRKIRKLYLAGHHRRAKSHLPVERAYPVSEKVASRLGIGL